MPLSSSNSLRKFRLLHFTAGGFGGIVLFASFFEWCSEHRQNEINELPRHYDAKWIDNYWRCRPITVATRLATIAYELLPLGYAYVWDFKLFPPTLDDSETGPKSVASLSHKEIDLQRIHSISLRQSLTRLGPAFIKIGQQLSIRPDLIPPTALKELQRLCDSVQPVPDSIAMNVLMNELGVDALSKIVDLELVAAASLGQVYKGKMKSSGQAIAVKIQRPDMIRKVSLDLFLLKKYGQLVDFVCDRFTKQVSYHEALMDSFAFASYSELDYEQEAENQRFFRDEFQKRKMKIYVPTVFSEFTSRRVITTEWIEGVKLSDAPQSHIRKLIPVGVELFLIQLLDMGTFHADPHPGNLFVTDSGMLCLLDYGLVAEIDANARRAMTAALYHLLTGDYDTLISRDAKDLGFLPPDLDTSELKPILTKILTKGLLESGSNLVERKRKLLSISEELNEVFFRYPFSVPPFFALITRGLALLEGIALSGDPNFDIFRTSYPFARKKAAEIIGTQSMNTLKRNSWIFS